MPDLLRPVTSLLGSALAGAHHLIVGLGLPPGPTWLLALVLLVVGLRLALLPLTVHGVRSAHAAAHARPHLAALQRSYGDLRRLSPDRLAAFHVERRAIQAEHGMSAWGCLPALAQLPLLLGLYHVVADLAAGRPVGALDGVLVSSAASASVLGVHLATRLDQALTRDPAQAAVVATLALVSAALSWATQRWFVLPTLDLSSMPAEMARVQHLMPTMAAVGVLVGAWVAPAGLLAYWVITNLWSLAQSAVIWRWWPTPGSPAAARGPRRG